MNAKKIYDELINKGMEDRYSFLMEKLKREPSNALEILAKLKGYITRDVSTAWSWAAIAILVSCLDNMIVQAISNKVAIVIFLFIAIFFISLGGLVGIVYYETRQSLLSIVESVEAYYLNKAQQHPHTNKT